MRGGGRRAFAFGHALPFFSLSFFLLLFLHPLLLLQLHLQPQLLLRLVQRPTLRHAGARVRRVERVRVRFHAQIFAKGKPDGVLKARVHRCSQKRGNKEKARRSLGHYIFT